MYNKKSDKNVSMNQTDSGFLSGSNLASSSSIIDDRENEKIPVKVGSPPCADSGIDISEQLTSLILQEKEPVILQEKESEKFDIRVPDYEFLEKVLQRDEDGDTQLHIAVIGGWVEHIWHITRKIPDQALLDLPNNAGRTALHLAVAAGDARVARHILVCGGSPVARDYRGNTPLHVACNLGDIGMVLELTKPITSHEVEAARIPYSQSFISGLVAADLNNYEGQTCIHIAAQTGNLQILQYLTHYGADINAKEGKCGRTALHYAVQQRDLKLVSFLVSSCHSSLSIESYSGLTPYQLALANDTPAIANLLVELGAQGEPLPTRYTNEDIEESEDGPSYSEYDSENWNRFEDLKIAGVHIPIPTTQAVSTAGPSCDFYQ